MASASEAQLSAAVSVAAAAAAAPADSTLLAANARAASDAMLHLRAHYDRSRAALPQPQRFSSRRSAPASAEAAFTFAPLPLFPPGFPPPPLQDVGAASRAQITLPPRDPSEILELHESLSGRPPLHAVCGHTAPSACYWCALSEPLQTPNWPFSTYGHGEDEKSRLLSCVTGEMQYEEDRWSWRQASDTSPVALAQYHADRLGLLELFRLKRAALFGDIRLLHGRRWPVTFGCLAGVEPLLQSFAALPPVVSTPPTLADLAAMADHEDVQAAAAAAGSEAYLRADTHARIEASKRSIFSELSYEDSQSWRRERLEWDRPCLIASMTRREFYLQSICDAGLIADLADVVLAYMIPPEHHFACEGRCVSGQPTLRTLKQSGCRVVAVAACAHTSEKGDIRFVLQPAVHPHLLQAIEASPEASARQERSGPLRLRQEWTLQTPPLAEAGTLYRHHAGFQVPQEAGWAMLDRIQANGRGDQSFVHAFEIFYVRDRTEKIRVTPSYHALQEAKPPRVFRDEEIQRGWRYCTACAQLWHAGDSGGVCPALSADSLSRAHTGLSDSAGVYETFYALVTTPLGGGSRQPEGTQADWRRCRACAVLFHGPSAHNSCCPAAAAAPATHDATGSLEYFVHAGGLCDAPQVANADASWRQCRDCTSLVKFKGVCPAAVARGPHTLSGRVFAPIQLAEQS